MGIVEQADCRREQADCRRSTLSLSRADERAIDVVIELLRPARRLLFITGAGISADSGLPTYRGRDGLYNRDGVCRDGVYRDGLTMPQGLTIEQALSGPMLAARPEITWHYLLELERFARGGVPNRGHRVIAEMESYFDAVWTVTQNVDGLHSRAGSRQVLDVHGDLHDLLCTQCDYKVTVPDYADLALPPLCPRCRGILRPTVVLYGEQVPEEKLDRLWYEFGVGFDVVFSVGTSSLFEYIAAPVELARAAGIATVEINPETTAVTSAGRDQDQWGCGVGAGPSLGTVLGRLAVVVSLSGTARTARRWSRGGSSAGGLRVRTAAPMPGRGTLPSRCWQPPAKARPPVPEILRLVGPGLERCPPLCHPPAPELGPDGQPHWLERRGAEFPCGLTFRGMASVGSPRVLGKNWAASGFSLPRYSRSGDSPRRPDTQSR